MRTRWHKKKKKKVRFPRSEFFLSKSKKSKIQELRIGDDISGRRVPRSGGIPGLRGDAENKKFLVEAKQTKKPKFPLTEEIVSKIDREAFSCSKIPAIVVEFQSMPFGPEPSWAAIPKGILDREIDASKLFFTEPIKLTNSKQRSVVINMSKLQDLDNRASAIGKIPVLLFEIVWLANVTNAYSKHWAMIPYSVFLKISKTEPEGELNDV